MWASAWVWGFCWGCEMGWLFSHGTKKPRGPEHRFGWTVCMHWSVLVFSLILEYRILWCHSESPAVGQRRLGVGLGIFHATACGCRRKVLRKTLPRSCESASVPQGKINSTYVVSALICFQRPLGIEVTQPLPGLLTRKTQQARSVASSPLDV